MLGNLFGVGDNVPHQLQEGNLMKEAVFKGSVISGEQGVDLRNSNRDAIFTCPECKEPVRVHRAGGNQPAHFEHRERNRICTLVYDQD